MSTTLPALADNGRATDHDEAMTIMADVITAGDLARLTPEQRVTYYGKVCQSLGLNPLTKPLEYVQLSGRLTLYANKNAAEQLRKLHYISIRITSQRIEGDVYVVAVEGTDPTGRTDSDIGAVPIAGLRGEALSNAMMKAVTKAKRRLTLSVCGLGLLDETEVDSIPNARRVEVDPATGEIVGSGTALPAPRHDGPEPPPPTQAERLALYSRMTKGLGWDDATIRRHLQTWIRHDSIRDMSAADYATVTDAIDDLAANLAEAAVAAEQARLLDAAAAEADGADADQWTR